MRLRLLLCLAALPMLPGCAAQIVAAGQPAPTVSLNAAPPAPNPAPPPAVRVAAPVRTALLQRGLATWYGRRQAGRRTSNGERFDPRQMTAAHSTLPMGCYVRVTVEDTGRTVVVRVNDREPPHGARIIDLSQGAAAELGIVSEGRARVSIAQATADEASEPVEVAEAPPAKPRRRRHP